MGGLVQKPEASLEESGTYRRPMPWLPDSNKRAFGKAGAVQLGHVSNSQMFWTAVSEV